jgi:hypothetical protein
MTQSKIERPKINFRARKKVSSRHGFSGAERAEAESGFRRAAKQSSSSGPRRGHRQGTASAVPKVLEEKAALAAEANS